MKNLNLINHIETAKSRLNNIRYHSLDSVTDGKGNKLKVWREDKWITDEYPFTEDNISIVHNHLLFFLFSLDLRDEELQPSDFIESFAGGYKEGLKFLDNEGIFLNDIADQNRRKNLLEILKRIIHERNFKGNTLLKKVYGNLPLIWNERNIREYGKYHGIKTAIDRMAKRAGIDAKDLQKDGKQELEEEKEFKNPYPHIFKGAGYVLWQRMFEDLKVTESSRTDARFMFEVLKKDDFIYENIGEKAFRDWINGTYEISMDKMPYTDPKTPSNAQRLALYQSIKSNL